MSTISLLIFYLLGLSITEIEVLKFSTVALDLSVSPFSSVSFWSFVLKSFYYVYKHFGLLGFLDEMTFFIPVSILCSEIHWFNNNLATPDFFWLVLACYVFFHLFTFFFFFFLFFFFFFLIYLFIFGCVGSPSLCEGSLQPRQAGTTPHRGARASHRRGLSRCGPQAPDAQAQ